MGKRLNKAEIRKLRRSSLPRRRQSKMSGQTKRQVNQAARNIQRTLSTIQLDTRVHSDGAPQSQGLGDEVLTRTLQTSIQQPMNTSNMPTLVSVFFSVNANTPEKMFDFGSCNSLDAIRNIVDEYFAPNLRKLSCPATVAFRALNCFHPKDLAHQWGGRDYARFARDQEYQLWYKSVSKMTATTGHIVRIQVCLWSDEVDRISNNNPGGLVANDTAHNSSDFLTRTDGAAWLMKQLTNNNPDYLQASYFQVVEQAPEAILIPVHRIREAAAAKRVADELRQNGARVGNSRDSKKMTNALNRERGHLEKLREENQKKSDRCDEAMTKNRELKERLEAANEEYKTLMEELEGLQAQLRTKEEMTIDDNGEEAMEGTAASGEE